jgi:ferredoxin
MPAVHCHLCGATLRRPDQFDEVARPDGTDVVYVCRDENRCATRASYDGPRHSVAEPRPARARR